MKKIDLTKVGAKNYTLAEEVNAYLDNTAKVGAIKALNLTNALYRVAINTVHKRKFTNFGNATLAEGLINKPLTINKEISSSMADSFLTDVLGVMHNEKDSNLLPYGFIAWENAFEDTNTEKATLKTLQLDFKIGTYNNTRDLHMLLAKLGPKQTVIVLLTIIYMFKY